MAVDSSFVKAPVNVPKLSGFDKSHHNILTSMPGTITPILIDELIPGSRVNLNLALSASLPPLASDTFMKCSVKVEAFFVPFRLLCGSFESWFTNEPKVFEDFGSQSFTSRLGRLPTFGMFDGTLAASLASQGLFDPGSLSDYLGFRPAVPASAISSFSFTAMPFLAYHKVYNDWYRNTLVQRDVFLPPNVSGGGIAPGTSSTYAGTAPFSFYGGANAVMNGLYSTADQLQLADGFKLFDLRQRNFGLDYFTTATPTAQQGAAEVVTFSTAGSTGQFSIAALRAANSLQQFKERNNLAGNLYVEQLYARYGVRPSDGVAQRALFLGSAEYECYSHGVFQTAMDSTPVGAPNPFSGTTAAQFGHGRASGNSHVAEFHVTEPGYFLVNATLVPRASYSSGIDRMWWHYTSAGSLTDLANPILQNVGPQPIYQSELDGNAGVGVFGYTDRYAEFKTKSDGVHGLIRDGSSLQSFALQRSFSPGTPPTINSAFLKIPVTFLDQITAVSGDVSQYGCWMDMYFDYKVSQPLAKYSLPSLQDPAYEHGRTVIINRGGSKL